MLDLLTARRISAAVLVVSFISTTLFSVAAHAAPLLVGGGFLAPAEPDGAGAFVAGGVAVPFASGGPNGFSGTLTATVIQETLAANPLGGYTFTYLLHNDNTSATAMERLTLVDFSTFATDVSYFLPGGGQAPSVVDRSFGVGAVIGWDFTGTPIGAGTLMPGATSALLVVQTSVTGYDLTQSASVIDGKTVSVPSIGPNTTIIQPEPTSITFLAMGIVAFGLRRRAA